jgi:2,4-dienoyl-CoA reductase-like NADH-dependent reductase (Old Yellow Enzyme family)
MDAAPAPDPFLPAMLGPVRLRNRFIKAATFEALSPDHVVTDELIAFHRRVAAGGVGMTTLAYCAVSREGCGTPNEIILSPGAVPGLRRLVDAVHGEGAALSVQIGHAGAVAVGSGARGLSPSPMFSPVSMRRTRAATAADLAGVVADFAAAARVARDGGADAVELHLGHGYLLSEFLSPRLNRRTDEWGGSTLERARLAREVCAAVRDTVGPDGAVIAKLNMMDGVSGGLGVDESIEVARLLQSDGALDAIELTGGSSLQNPMFLFKGDAPIAELAASMRLPMRVALRLFGSRFMRTYPFEEGYFRPEARRVRAALDLPLILLGGINRLDTVYGAMADGFAFVALGRALLMEPDLIDRWRDDPSVAGSCTHCNRCMATIYRGTRCVLVPPTD